MHAEQAFDDDDALTSQITMLPVSSVLCTLAHVGKEGRAVYELDGDTLPDVEASMRLASS